jgi:hypothetical protein
MGLYHALLIGSRAGAVSWFRAQPGTVCVAGDARRLVPRALLGAECRNGPTLPSKLGRAIARLTIRPPRHDKRSPFPGLPMRLLCALAALVVSFAACSRKPAAPAAARDQDAGAAIASKTLAADASPDRGVPPADAAPARDAAPNAPVEPRPEVVARPEHLFVGFGKTCLRTAPSTVRCWSSRYDAKPARLTTYVDTVFIHGKFFERFDGSWGCDRINLLPLAEIDTVHDLALEGPGRGASDRIPAIAGASFVHGEHHVCALVKGRVLCWGLNDFMQLGYDTEDSCYYMKTLMPCSHTPAEPRGLGEVAELAVGFEHACARKARGGVLCWGRIVARSDTPPCAPTSVESGDEPRPCKARGPVRIGGLDDAVQIASNATRMCAVLKNGTVSCIGTGAPNITETGEVRGPTVAAVRPGFEDVAHIAMGPLHTCAITRKKTVVCQTACGAGYCEPYEVPDLDDVVEIGVDQQHACALRSDRSLWCWGSRAAMGLGGTGDAQTPVRLVVDRSGVRAADVDPDAAPATSAEADGAAPRDGATERDK